MVPVCSAVKGCCVGIDGWVLVQVNAGASVVVYGGYDYNGFEGETGNCVVGMVVGFVF